jgi:hypothetical protein
MDEAGLSARSAADQVRDAKPSLTADTAGRVIGEGHVRELALTGQDIEPSGPSSSAW